HIAEVVNPWLKALRGKVGLVAYSLPGKEDDIRKKLYRSIRSTPSESERKQGSAELAAALKQFSYKGGPLPTALSLDAERPVADYFKRHQAWAPGRRSVPEGLGNLPTPIVRGIELGEKDVVIYDGDGYPPLRDFLKKQGIRHILLAGYCTDMCVASTTAG